jgi:hypothetical protein
MKTAEVQKRTRTCILCISHGSQRSSTAFVHDGQLRYTAVTRVGYASQLLEPFEADKQTKKVFFTRFFFCGYCVHCRLCFRSSRNEWVPIIGIAGVSNHESTLWRGIAA